MTPLTREQVEALCERIHKEITWKHEINYILETDASLRDLLRQREEEVEMLTKENHELMANLESCNDNELANEVDELRAQLAAMSRERDISRLAYMILTGTYKPAELLLSRNRTERPPA